MQFFSCIILAIVGLLLGKSPVKAAIPLDLTSDTNIGERATNDGKKLANEMYKTTSDLKDYSFDSKLYMFKPAPHESGAGTYLFKRPNLVRLQIKSNGIKDGTVIVRQPDGRVRVVGGPKLRFLKMNLDADSRILRAPNGYNVIKSDLASLSAQITEAVASGSKALATATPIALSRFKQNVSILQILKPSGVTAQITDRIFIDPQTDVPVEWDVFRDGDIYSVTIFDNFKTNLGLEDDQFKI